MPTPTPTPDEVSEFASFMRAYQDMVFSTAARLTANDAYAEDIAQEVFLKAYENFSSLRVDERAGGWLKSVATNLSLNHLSRYRRRWRFFSELTPDHEDEVEFDIAAPETLLADLDSTSRAILIDKALTALPDRQRVPLVLFHFEEMPYDEIAKRLGVTLAKVKIDIYRGRVALAKALTDLSAAKEVRAP